MGSARSPSRRKSQGTTAGSGPAPVAPVRASAPAPGALWDAERLAALRRIALLDTPAEEGFDRLTRLASTLLQVPIVLVTLVDADRQFFKSAVGLPEPWATLRQTPLSHSFCRHVVATGSPLVLGDARTDATLRENPAIAELGVVAYAGIPLVTSQGEVLGSFCAIDTRPRHWSTRDLAALTDLAAAVIAEIEARAAVLAAARMAERMARLQSVTSALSDALTPARVADVVLHQGLAALDAQAGSVALLTAEGRDLEVVASAGYGPAILEPYRRFPLTALLPLAEAAHTGEPLFLESSDAWQARYPQVLEHRLSGNEAAAAIPLMVEGRLLGSLGLSFAEPQPFGAADREFIQTLARLCAQALERARLIEAQRAADLRNAATLRLAEEARQAEDDQRLRATSLAAALEARQAQLEAVVHQMPVGVILAEAPSGRVILANAEGERLLQHAVRADSIAAYAQWQGFHPDWRPYRPEELPLARALNAGEVVRDEEIHLRRLDGTSIALLASAMPIRDAAGAIVAAVVTFSDITERMALDRAREEFLTAAAHDLKTPLTAVRGSAQLARRRLARLDGPEAATIAELLARVDAGIQRMSALINELVDVTRTQMGQGLDLHRQPTDVVALLRGLVDRYAGAAGQRLRLDSTLPELYAEVDASRFDRAVGNVLSNAVKYSPNGGEIVVRVWREEGPSGREAVIAVADQGMGIPAADLPRVFDRFQRAENVVGRIEGTGIGLASARQIVEQHGGTIRVVSTEGKGATFTIRLPLRTVPQPG